MLETALSATVLICAVLLIRGLLKDHIPAGARYGLWLLVALRLLVPVNLGVSPVSVANWTAGARQAQSPLSALTDGPSSGPAEPDHLPPMGGRLWTA